MSRCGWWWGVCSALTAEDTCASQQTRRRNCSGRDLLASCTSSPGCTPGTWAGPSMSHASWLGLSPPLAALSLSSLSQPGRALCRDTPECGLPPPPGLPEQAACVRGWEGLGRHCDACLSSRPAWTSSGPQWDGARESGVHRWRGQGGPSPAASPGRQDSPPRAHLCTRLVPELGL